MKEKLKKCPFCGEKKIEIERCNCGCNDVHIECSDCHATIWRKGKQKAIKAWNRRVK